ncbi:MAG: hypothetical protein J6U21_05375, partial [Bacteroidales bacterium]|nr:hypothetical protein [Bacteroidales bacterium]
EVVSGTITITNSDGSYEAVFNYQDPLNLIGSLGFTATRGTKLTTISDAYNSLKDAVSAAYYTINFNVAKKDDGTYYMYTREYGTETDIKIYLKSAFIRAMATRTIKVEKEDKSVVAGKYYIVPTQVGMGEKGSWTQAGKVYNVKKQGTLSYGAGDILINKEYGGSPFIQPLTHVGGGTVTYSIENKSTQGGTVSINSSTGEVTYSGYCRATITATVADDDEYSYPSKTASYDLSIVPDGFVDFGMVNDDGISILWAKSDLTGYYQWGSTSAINVNDQHATPGNVNVNNLVENYYTHANTRLPENLDAAYKNNNSTRIPMDVEWYALTEGYWVWTRNEYRVYRPKFGEHSGQVKTKTGGPDYTEYYSDSDPYISFYVGSGNNAYQIDFDGLAHTEEWIKAYSSSLKGSCFWSSDYDSDKGSAGFLNVTETGVNYHQTTTAPPYQNVACWIRPIMYLKY